jgi:hypothetical protein
VPVTASSSLLMEHIYWNSLEIFRRNPLITFLNKKFLIEEIYHYDLKYLYILTTYRKLFDKQSIIMS